MGDAESNKKIKKIECAFAYKNTAHMHTQSHKDPEKEHLEPKTYKEDT